MSDEKAERPAIKMKIRENGHLAMRVRGTDVVLEFEPVTLEEAASRSGVLFRHAGQWYRQFGS